MIAETGQMAAPRKAVSLVETLASKYGMEASKLLPTLKATAFRTNQGEVTDEQMAALLVVANEYGLNPFTKELFAFPDKQGIIPVVSVDGWARIINSQPAMNGISFRWADDMTVSDEHKPCPEWCECVINRRDRDEPIVIREYFDEVYRTPFKKPDGYVVKGPWQTHTKRMLRHKAMIQCARIAFGFAGIYDPDEAQRIREVEVVTDAEYTEVKTENPVSGADRLKIAITTPDKAPIAATQVVPGPDSASDDPHSDARHLSEEDKEWLRDAGLSGDTESVPSGDTDSGSSVPET